MSIKNLIRSLEESSKKKMSESNCYMEMMNPEYLDGLSDEERIGIMTEMVVDTMDQYTSSEMDAPMIVECMSGYLSEMKKR